MDNKARCVVDDDAVYVTILMGAELRRGRKIEVVMFQVWGHKVALEMNRLYNGYRI